MPVKAARRYKRALGDGRPDAESLCFFDAREHAALWQNREMDDAHDMRAFVEVARSGSFQRAATILGQTKSALSKAVARLEDRIGVRLVTRTTRQLALTDEGRSYLADCERILAEIEGAADRVRQQRAAPRGPLRVEFPLLWGREQVVPLLARFR